MVLWEHALVATNVYISNTKVVCWLPISKAHKGPLPQSVYLYKQPNVTCPVTAFIQYAKVRLPKGSQFFIKVDDNPINRGDLDNILRRLSEFLDLPHQHFKPHSLRIVTVHISICQECQCTKLRQLVDGPPMPSKSTSEFNYVISLQWLTKFGSSGTG